MSLLVRDLTLSHPGQPPILRGAALDLRPGDRLAILGGNGAGKTTLGRALAGLIAPMQGQILWNDRAWYEHRRAERAGMVQFVGQQPWLQLSGRAFTVREEIAFGPENLCLPRSEIARRTDEAMELLGLTHLARRNCRHLSGGETQRLVLAGALAMHPQLLVLDEPMIDLDLQTRETLAGHLNNLPWQMAVVFLDVAAQPWMRGLVRDQLEIRDGGLQPPQPDPAPPEIPVPPVPDHDLDGPAIRLNGLSFGYKDAPPLFRDVTLDIPKGSVTAVLGPNGAGKSSLLRLLSGLERPTAGRIDIAGYDPVRANPKALAAHIGVTFQASDRHFVQARVVDEVALALRYQGIAAAKARFRAGQVLAWMGMADLAKAHPLDLHAGARRMVALAGAVAHGPDVLMLDESQRGLDAAHLARLEALIGFLAARGAAVLIVTHDQDFATRVASHRLMLGDGGMQLAPATGVLPPA
ncbi:ATP-binding cassette domain-containing protein [Paracoccus lutimaris]|uniref:Energy-coupling factor transport system ATP-binding protein n=1 Tax=Paracoccus lutimaris TaxID=1490030 RepID=A0A368YND9_9RHOB|nr:ABC transporter ATP-binding protein [Paracoccus lutimaris]RCW81743.1 energy-coupling factor transport system ATP-binding protein [Paracoccus lutimaris]